MFTKKILVLFVLSLILVISPFSAVSSKTTSTNISGRILQEQSSSFVDLGKPPFDVINWEYAKFYVPITESDINEQIKLDFVFSAWNSHNVLSSVNPVLSLEVYSPSNALIANVSIPVFTNEQALFLNTTTTGNYLCKLVFNYQENIIDNPNDFFNLHAAFKLEVTGLNTGSVYEISKFGQLYREDSRDYVALQDFGNKVVFWINISTPGYYTLETQIMSNTIKKVTDSIVFTKETGNVTPITVNVGGLSSNHMKNSINIPGDEAGIWKMSYTETLETQGMSYWLRFGPINAGITNIVFPLQDESSPFHATNINNHITITPTTPFGDIFTTLFSLTLVTAIASTKKRQ